MRSLGLVMLVTTMVLVATSVQEGGYSATAGELEYISQNDYMMWFLQGADTLGEPINTRTKESHSYSDAGELIQVNVRLEGIDMAFESNTTMKIERTGRVVEVNGAPVEEAEDARVDFLPRIPVSGALEGGMTWVDTVSSFETKPYGSTRYRAERSYRVVGPAQVDGRSTVLIVGEGTLALRQGGWQSEEQGVFWWQEVEGPVIDSVWFSNESGQLIRDITFMDLVGTGGFGNGQQEVRMESGLRSRVERVLQPGAL